jgi:Flp pilus assembly protein TadB
MSRLRLALAVAGFATALLAVVTENPRVGWVAIGLLLASLFVRLLQRRRSAERSEEQPGSG